MFQFTLKKHDLKQFISFLFVTINSLVVRGLYIRVNPGLVLIGL